MSRVAILSIIFVHWHKSFCKIDKGMRVLIADDQRSVGTTLAALVSHCDAEVVEVVGSGLDAIYAYTKHKPDVVLMDYWMPKLNGATACRNILAKDPDARIVLVSGLTGPNEVADSGAAAMLPKPLSLGLLAEVLHSVAKPNPRLA